MRKVSEKPAEIKKKIEAKEGFDLRLDLKNGKLNKRNSVFAVPCKEIESDKKGYKKLELVTGQIVYHKRSTIPDQVAGRRIQQKVIIEGHELNFMAMHELAVSRLLFNCSEALAQVRELMPKSIAPILNWTEWHMYRSGQKTLRVRNYNHEKFYSDHAKNIDAKASEKKAAEAPKEDSKEEKKEEGAEA